MSINYSSSVYLVKDVNVSRRFYEKLGQRVKLDHGECVVFESGVSIWLKEHAHNIMFKGKPMPEKGHEDVELYFVADDIMAARELVSGCGARFVHDIEEQPWGQRVFRAYDPDGHIIEFGEPMEVVIKRYLAQGMPVEDTAKRTSMPLDIVKQVAGQAR
jgi:catechol 2,3-dioxygenase-like lactoylglutathione lyase family enzyme